MLIVLYLKFWRQCYSSLSYIKIKTFNTKRNQITELLLNQKLNVSWKEAMGEGAATPQRHTTLVWATASPAMRDFIPPSHKPCSRQLPRVSRCRCDPVQASSPSPAWSTRVPRQPGLHRDHLKTNHRTHLVVWTYCVTSQLPLLSQCPPACMLPCISCHDGCYHPPEL